MAVEVRPAEASDRPLLLALSEAAFGAPANAAEWAWKYDANPHGAVSDLPGGYVQNRRRR